MQGLTSSVCGALLACALVLVLPSDVRAWQAYDDLHVGTNSTTDTNCVSAWTSDKDELPHANTGPLKNYWTGADLPVTVTITGGGQSHVGTAPDEGTDAYTNFAGFLDCTGTVDYANPPCTLSFEHLDPESRYTFTLFGCRSNPKYGKGKKARVTKMTITDADAFKNTSTPGSWITGDHEESTIITNGHNMQGWVARWTDIAPGQDADFSVVCDAFTEKGLYLTAFKLETANVPEPGAVLAFVLSTTIFLAARRAATPQA